MHSSIHLFIYTPRHCTLLMTTRRYAMALERQQDEVQRALQRTQLVLVCLTKAYMDAIASSVRPPRPRHPARPAAGLWLRAPSFARPRCRARLA